MLEKLIERCPAWVEAMAAIDYPLGEYVLMLERRIGKLEHEIAQIRTLNGSVASNGSAPTK